MAQTFYLPITENLTGDLADQLPEDLVFRNDKARQDSPPLSRTQARIMYPFGYDPVADVQTRPGDVIKNLGVIDPVDISERGSGPNVGVRWAGDDYFVTLAVIPNQTALDDGSFAVCRIVDAAGCDRFGCFNLPLPAPENGVRVCSRYGLPMTAGDRIVLEWQGDGNFAGVVIVTVAAATTSEAYLDAICCLIKVSGEGPVPPGCEPPVITSYTTVPTPVVEGVPGPPVAYDVTVNGAGFLPSDVVTIVGGPSGAIPVLTQTFVSGVEWDLDIHVPAGKLAGTYQLTVTRELDDGCFASFDFPVAVGP